MAPPFRGYFKETRRPVYSAALLLPFFLVYHIGTFFLKTTYINGADALILRLLSLLSVNSMFASALVLLACFVVWQFRTGAKWTLDARKLTILFLESACFALLLFFSFGWLSTHMAFAMPSGPGPGRLQKLVLYCGAGVYEELVFRGFLLGGLMLLLTRGAGWKKGKAAVVAVITGAMVFAGFHYIGPAADSFSLGSFLQRTLGGLYFSVLFVTRGFGVTAAAHALYDILVGLILA
jgi:membrane protease YdiL (CAAX protease family)